MKREELVKIVGIENVNKLESENCEPTNAVNGPYQVDDLTEWEASIDVTHNGKLYRISAYYYTDNDDEEEVEENGGDWGAIDWQIHHYTCEQI